MEGLTTEEKAYFESGGATEAPGVTDAPSGTEAEAPAEAPKPAPAPAAKAEVPQAERKKPSQFTYSEDTDNVSDDLGRKYVPLGAVQEARTENKKLRSELEEFRQKWTQGEGRLNDLIKKLEPKPAEPPSYEKDPLAHLKARLETLETENKSLKEGHSKVEQRNTDNDRMAEFSQAVTAHEKAFTARNADYAEAVAKVQEVWRAEYEEAGMPPQFIDSAIARKGAQFSAAALQKQQNPAEQVYKLAQRYGYKKSEQKDEPNKDKEKLATIAKGQEAGKTLPSGKGADFGLEDIASMSDEEMDEFVKDPKKWNKFARAVG